MSEEAANYVMELLQRIISQNPPNPRLSEKWLKLICDLDDGNNEEIANAMTNLIEQDPVSTFAIQVAEILHSVGAIDLFTILKILLKRLEYCLPIPRKEELETFIYSELIYWRLLGKILQTCDFQIIIENWIYKCHLHRIKQFDELIKNQKELCDRIRQCFHFFHIQPDIELP